MVEAVLVMIVVAPAQMQSRKELFVVQDHAGQANVIRFDGRVFVEVQDLAAILKGSLRVEKDTVTLSLPRCDDEEHKEGEPVESGFSREFMKAAIESMATMREWGGLLAATVQNYYPVDSAVRGNTIIAYQERAADTVRLASAAASTDSDRRGVQLLEIELSRIRAWADRLVAARKSLIATDLTTSETPLKNDEEAQNLLHCGQLVCRRYLSGRRCVSLDYRPIYFVVPPESCCRARA